MSALKLIMETITTEKEIGNTLFIIESIVPTKADEKVIKEKVKKLILNNIESIKKMPDKGA